MWSYIKLFIASYSGSCLIAKYRQKLRREKKQDFLLRLGTMVAPMTVMSHICEPYIATKLNVNLIWINSKHE